MLEQSCKRDGSRCQVGAAAHQALASRKLTHTHTTHPPSTNQGPFLPHLARVRVAEHEGGRRRRRRRRINRHSWAHLRAREGADFRGSSDVATSLTPGDLFTFARRQRSGSAAGASRRGVEVAHPERSSCRARRWRCGGLLPGTQTDERTERRAFEPLHSRAQSEAVGGLEASGKPGHGSQL